MRLFNSGSKKRKMALGYWMLLEPDVPEQRVALDSGHFDYYEIQFCRRVLPDDGVFLDIGANIGQYACALGKQKSSGRSIHAFEPGPATFRRLRENIALNKLERCVEAENLALGREPGNLLFHMEPEGTTNNAVGDHMLGEHDRASIQAQGWSEFRAEVVRLDDWANERGVARCDLIKIDVEGAELPVFEGGRKFVEQCRPVVLGEFNPYWMKQQGMNFHDVMDWFGPLEYRIFRLMEGNVLPISEKLIAVEPEIPSYILAPAETTVPEKIG